MRRPWNAVNFPVYSLSVHSKDDHNMNICTYVNPTSLKPKLYAIALDTSTKTYQLAKKSDHAILQFLSNKQSDLVKLLGKKSGFNIDKIQQLEKNGEITNWKSFKVLSGAASWLKLKKLKCIKTGGDHDLFIFQVENIKTNTQDFLYFQTLISQGIILS